LTLLLADKTYVLGDSDSFTHTAGNYVTGTCAAGTIVYSARQTNLSALPAWLTYSSLSFTVTSALEADIEIEILATDSDTGTFIISDSFTITVFANTAPAFDSELTD